MSRDIKRRRGVFQLQGKRNQKVKKPNGYNYFNKYFRKDLKNAFTCPAKKEDIFGKLLARRDTSQNVFANNLPITMVNKFDCKLYFL